MEETNDYGMYSSGYIFDQMHKAALLYVKHEGGLSDDTMIVTQAVDGLRYKRQLCDKYNVTVRCFDFHMAELFSKLYFCKAEVINNKGEIVAEADFVFITENETRPQNVQPDVETRPENVQQVSYMAPGDITVFYGFGCSVEFDTPLPRGTRITIKSTTKGDNDERYEMSVLSAKNE